MSEEMVELVLPMQFLVHYLQPQLMELLVQLQVDIFQVVALVEVVFPLLQELMELVVPEEVQVSAEGVERVRRSCHTASEHPIRAEGSKAKPLGSS